MRLNIYNHEGQLTTPIGGPIETTAEDAIEDAVEHSGNGHAVVIGEPDSRDFINVPQVFAADGVVMWMNLEK